MDENDRYEWRIELQGVGNDIFLIDDNTVEFEELVSMRVERMGHDYLYMGLPLSVLIGKVDESISVASSQKLWNDGYDITLTGSEGYSVTFNTGEIDSDNMLLAVMRDGEYIRPAIVGGLSSKYHIEHVVEIVCDTEEEAGQQPYNLEMNIQGELFRFSREELESSPYVVEGLGGYTTSSGTYHEQYYTGVHFADFLSSIIPVQEESVISVEALDGYKMSYSGADLLDEGDGVWILAFRSDGQYIPLDPGIFRTVKIAGEKTPDIIPNINGNSSARMVKRISYTDESFRDFTLLIKGKITVELDRATIQSGISGSSHGTRITYTDRKTHTDELYTGIPLYYLLAYADDELYQPHKQSDKSILAYDREAAEAGYRVRVSAADGYSVTLDSRELHNNNDVVLAMYEDESELKGEDWPLKLVWDKHADVIPEGIKAVRNVVSIELLF